MIHPPPVLHDRYARRIHYLRVSVTDVCNLRCVYCMPEDMTFRPGEELLQDDEILRLLQVFARLGVDKVRFTGGEPTLRTNITGMVGAAAAMPGIQTVGITTNGILLRTLARPLAGAGLRGVNISLDTLDPDRFAQLTRWGHLADVLRGIQAAEAEGLKIKINCVVVRGRNDGDDVVELARLTLTRPWQIRYIEMMPFGGLPEFQTSHSVPEAELRARIEAALGSLDLCHGGRLDGEARVFRLRDALGTLGFISPVTAPFCAGCNRIRLTADGKLRLCLLREREVDLRTPLRDGTGDPALEQIIREAVFHKPWGHGLAEHQFATNRTMSEIGG